MSSFFARNLKRSYPIVDSAEGVWVTDTSGLRYLDGCSGAIAANLGHGLPQINDALLRQLKKVSFAHTSQFLSQPALDLAEQLISLAPGSFRNGRVSFASGGSEAVETALKLGRAYYCERDGENNRTLFISRWNSYHGGTFGALGVTGHPARRKPYYGLLREQPHIRPAYPYRCDCGHGPGACVSTDCALTAANELEKTILRLGAENIVGFIGEPVVGAALGAVAPLDAYWPRVREICTKYGILLIADEVMTGLGRCGANFAMDRWGVEPDIIIVGKGLAAGYVPLSGVLAASHVVAPFLADKSSGIFEHGFTYSGHPLACAAGLAVAKYMQDNQIVESVRSRESSFRKRLDEFRKFGFVGDVRSTGFMAGIEFVADQQSKAPFPAEMKVHRVVADAALKAGLLVYPGAGFIDGGLGDHVMVAPPLNISDLDMDTLFERLGQAFSSVEKQVLAACT